MVRMTWRMRLPDEALAGGRFGGLAVVGVPVEEDAEGLVGVVVEEVEGFGGAGVGEAVGGHAVGVMAPDSMRARARRAEPMCHWPPK